MTHSHSVISIDSIKTDCFFFFFFFFFLYSNCLTVVIEVLVNSEMSLASLLGNLPL